MTETTQRGHWPKGKRRNADTGWEKILTSLQSVLATHRQHGVCSPSALASHLGVTRMTVGRWIDGTDRPCPETQLLVKKWVKAVLKTAATKGE